MQFQPWDNPMGTDGFEFVEYAAPDPKALGALFERMGFTAIARHRHKDVTLYRQGGINFIINAERFRIGGGVFDELETVGPHRVVPRLELHACLLVRIAPV